MPRSEILILLPFVRPIDADVTAAILEISTLEGLTDRIRIAQNNPMK